jgi:type VI secretion system protein ImpL
VKRISKVLFGWLASRMVISAVGLLLVAVLIWFLGQFWSPLQGVLARIVVIDTIVLLWVLYTVWTAYRAKNTDRKISEELLKETPAYAKAEATREEIAGVRERFREALAALRTVKLGGRFGRRYLSQLPWFIIIGPPGVGKTTALKASGLTFPLASAVGEDPRIRGVHGTRNCDWFFADEAVLIDTAGRYTTYESDEVVDRAGWQGFLDLLRKHHRPIDGILVAFSCGDLLTLDAETLRLHALAVRRRVQEIYTAFNRNIPVYVLFTKVDLVAGFREFFDGLNHEERAQVWGITFTLRESENVDAALAAFDQDFERLIERLDQRTLPKLEVERDLPRCTAVLNFPRQMTSLKEAVRQLLAGTFQAHVLEKKNFLRGVYFTSGTQEGTPIDRVISTLSATFGLDRSALPPAAARPRSYFLTRLLQGVIFDEVDVVAPVRWRDRHRAWIVPGVYSGTAVVALLALATWAVSYAKNQEDLQTTSEATLAAAEHKHALADPRASLNDIIPALDALRELPGNRYGDAPVPTDWFKRIGPNLYQGERLAQAATKAYQDALEKAFIPRVVAYLEEDIGRLQGPANENVRALYDALKLYLTLAEPNRFAGAGHQESALASCFPNPVTAWAKADLHSSPLRAEPSPQHLVPHLKAALQAIQEGRVAAVYTDPSLVELARDSLAQTSPAQRIYAQLKSAVLAKHGEVWRLTAHVPDNDLRYFKGPGARTGIPELFTPEGYVTIFLKESMDTVDCVTMEVAWVMGAGVSGVSGERLSEQVVNLYFNDYVRHWENLLRELDIRVFVGLADAVNAMDALAAIDSPMKRVLAAVADQTRLRVSGPFAIAQENSGESETTGGEESAAPLAPPDNAVTRRFQPLHELLQSGDETAPPIDRALDLLKTLHVHLVDILDALEEGRQLPGERVIQRVRLEADRQPDPFGRWLRTIADQSAQVISSPAAEYIAEVWSSSVGRKCRDALAGRYPLDPGSRDDATLRDFAEMFAAGGLIETFFNEHLAPFVDKSAESWKWRPADGVVLEMPASVLQHFQDADAIRNAFFATGGTDVAVPFYVKPLYLRGARMVRIQIGDQQLQYRSGPPKGMRIEWPKRNDPVAAMIMEGFAGPAAQLRYDGPWSLFRLLDQARVEPTTSGERFDVTFTAAGATAAFELRAETASNPFDQNVRNALRRFRCELL